MTTVFGSASALQARRKIRRLADDASLLRLARSDQIADHDEARWRCRRGFAAERCDFSALTACDQLQPRPYRPLGVVLVRLRIAEIDQHAVAHVLRHEAAEALHSLGDALLIGGNDLAQVLRVHARRECRRTDEVREHHRDLAALGSVVGPWLRWGNSRFRCSGVGPPKLPYGCEYFPPMPERDAEFLEVSDRLGGAERRHRCRSRQNAARTRTCRAFRATPQFPALRRTLSDGR